MLEAAAAESRLPGLASSSLEVPPSPGLPQKYVLRAGRLRPPARSTGPGGGGGGPRSSSRAVAARERPKTALKPLEKSRWNKVSSVDR